jgi:hypothetical protein
MESESSLLCPKQPANSLFPEPDLSSQQFSTLFLKCPF